MSVQNVIIKPRNHTGPQTEMVKICKLFCKTLVSILREGQKISISNSLNQFNFDTDLENGEGDLRCRLKKIYRSNLEAP